MEDIGKEEEASLLSIFKPELFAGGSKDVDSTNNGAANTSTASRLNKLKKPAAAKTGGAAARDILAKLKKKT